RLWFQREGNPGICSLVRSYRGAVRHNSTLYNKLYDYQRIDHRTDQQYEQHGRLSPADYAGRNSNPFSDADGNSNVHTDFNPFSDADLHADGNPNVHPGVHPFSDADRDDRAGLLGAVHHYQPVAGRLWNQCDDHQHRVDCYQWLESTVLVPQRADHFATVEWQLYAEWQYRH